MSFVQLQVLSTNSLMKSTTKVDDLIISAKNKGYKTIALTDEGVLTGAVEFYQTAIEHGLKPIIGMTVDIQGYLNQDKSYQFVLLAKNFKGYQELINLSTIVQVTEEKLTLEDLKANSENIIIISSGEKSEIIEFINNENILKAKEIMTYLSKQFDDFYLGVSIQKINDRLLSFYKNRDYPMVALGNVQYLEVEDALPTRVLRVLQSEFNLDEQQPEIVEYLNQTQNQYTLKKPTEMKEEYENLDLVSVANETVNIANRVELKLELDQYEMPKYPISNAETADSYLKKLCYKNLKYRINDNMNVYMKRLENELTVISSMGFSDYFLIVWDIMNYAHQQNIYTGSGRGSAAGSLVAYLLKITNVDPIQYNLLFERFLNKDRFTMPDIDLDFPDNRREEILQYIFKKYGKDYVAQIGTLGTYGAKSAIRDVARVLGASQNEIKEWAMTLPNKPNLTLNDAEKTKDVQKLINKNEKNKRIFMIAKKIEGRNRHVSTHAAGIVISNEPLIKKIPLQKGSNNIFLTQYTMDDVESVGLLKLDILGLRNLSILSDCIKFMPYENDNKKIDIDNIPLDDHKTLEIFKKGETDGVFQFESPGIRRVLRKLQPHSFEDIVAVNALYRPGPMQQIDTYINRKNKHEDIRFPHIDLKEILEVTNGIMVYQEQVMKVASKMAGYSLNEADILRRAISQKDHHAMDEERRRFTKEAQKKGYSEDTATEVYNYIEKFADYGFNRSHAVAYSKVAYQLAYVKANYPTSFYTAIMQNSSKNKIKDFMIEAKRSGVEFLPPEINKSYYSFIIDERKIRFGFNIIKGLPRNFTKEIIEERRKSGKYKDFIHFLKRIDQKWLSENQIKPLIYSGMMDNLGNTRNSLLISLDSIIQSIQMSHGNMELFDVFSPSIVQQEELSDEEKMNQEYEVTDFYFTAEPGEKYNQLRNDTNIMYINQIDNQKFSKILVVVENIKRIQTKNGEPMSFVDVVDSTGKANLTLFPKVHLRYIQKINEGDTIQVEGRIEPNNYPMKMIVNKIVKADELLKKENSSPTLYIRFQSLKNEKKKLTALQSLLQQNSGDTPVIIYDEETKEQKAFKKEFHVHLNSKLNTQLNKMFGNKNIVIKK